MADASAPASPIRHARVPSEHSALWRLKVRLQFTGWLQYLPSAGIALAALLLAGIGWWVGVWAPLLVWIPLSVAALALANFAFEIATFKLGLRLPEPIPAAHDDLGAFDLMRLRRSCRSFQPRTLTESHRRALLAAAARHTAPDTLLGDHPVRLEYVAAPLTVWPVVGAHEFLVAIGPKRYDRTAILDVGRSLQKVVIDATRMGIATCWIGPGADHRSILRHLGDRFDPEADHIVCVCAVGYASRLVPLTVRMLSRSMGSRLPTEALFFADPEFGRPLDLDTPPFRAFGRCFEACRWSPSSYNSQTTRAVGVLDDTTGRGPRVRMDFYATTASRFYAPVALGIWCTDWETGCEALGIDGHVAILPAAARAATSEPTLPRYDLSWIADAPVGAAATAAAA